MSNELFTALIAGSLAGGGGGSTETDDYNNLKNKPKINGTKLEGNLSLSDIGAATSDQGDKADSAVQPEDLGSAAAANTSDFATAAQGDKADNAIQGIKVNSTTVNPDANKVVNITIPTKAADVSALPATTKYAAALRLIINSSTFVVTGQLIDQDGNDLGTAQTIDLPLESVVVDGSYNSQTKKVVLTLQNGNTIEFSVADLVSGLQTELSASNKLNPAYINYDSTHAAVTEAQRDQIETNKNNITSLYNSGQKNHLSINTSTYTASGSNRALKIPVDSISGTIHIYFGEITSTDTDDTTCGVLLVDSNDNTIQTLQFGRGTNKDMSVYVGSTAVASVSIYPATNWTNSADDTVSITKGMICSQDAWGATGGTYEPYAMSNADITAWIIAHS